VTAPISPTGAQVSPIASTSSASSADNTKLDSQAFLKLLVAQLQYQDPSKPVDTSSFMNETATLTQVQTMESSAQASTEMLAAQRAQTAGSLVGHTVSYTAADGTTQTGFVSAATISSANPTLRIGDNQIDLSRVQQVLASTASTANSTI
jgi:flagellar basal-body rod modification protein FlgD